MIHRYKNTQKKSGKSLFLNYYFCSLKMKLEMAKLLQDTIEETAGFSRDPEVAQDFADFVKKVFRGIF